MEQIETWVTIQEMDRESSVTMTHRAFDNLILAANDIQAGLNLIRRGLQNKTQIYLQDDIFINVRSKHAACPIDIRKYEDIDGKVRPTSEGQALSAMEWDIIVMLLPDIHHAIQLVKNKVVKIMRQVQLNLEEFESMAERQHAFEMRARRNLLRRQLAQELAAETARAAETATARAAETARNCEESGENKNQQKEDKPAEDDQDR